MRQKMEMEKENNKMSMLHFPLMVSNRLDHAGYSFFLKRKAGRKGVPDYEKG